MNCLKCRFQIDQPTLAHYGLHPNCFTDWFKAPITANFVSLQRRSSASEQSTEQPIQNISFFHGKFKKYSADLDGQSYLLKMRQDDAPELPKVEYLCNQIAKALGVSVAEFYFINHGVKPRRSGRGCKPAGLTLMWRALLFYIGPDY